MIDNAQTGVAAIEAHLLDDAYLAWFSAESECESTLHGWFRPPCDLSAGEDISRIEGRSSAKRPRRVTWSGGGACPGPGRETLLEGYEPVCE